MVADRVVQSLDNFGTCVQILMKLGWYGKTTLPKTPLFKMEEGLLSPQWLVNAPSLLVFYKIIWQKT